MRKYPFDYTINPENSPVKFKEACKKIDVNFPEFVKEQLLVDVDGSTIQLYVHENKNVAVYDDYDVGAVYVQSEIDLGNIF